MSEPNHQNPSLPSADNPDLAPEAPQLASTQLAAELRHSRQMLLYVLDTFPGLVFWKDRHSVFLGCNKEFAMAAGKQSQDEIIGKTDADLPWAPNETASYLKDDRQVLETGKPLLNTVESQLQADGRLAWFETSKLPIHDNHGNIIGLLGTSHDITERKTHEEALRQAQVLLEKRVEERTSSLQLANKELESFAYAVSHDLRAPLRGIDGWSQVLIEDYGGKLDEQAMVYLQAIRARSQRMSQLIDALLRLSFVARCELKREPVNLSLIAREIMSTMQNEEPGRKAQIHIQENLVANGDPALLRVVLENLLSNAWKFTSKNAETIIKFGVDQDGKSAIYHVRDNGIGFAHDQNNKIFSPFRRLHPSNEYPGTGVGLATVQRIIHRHEGKIWVEAVPNQGATFFFTLS